MKKLADVFKIAIDWNEKVLKIEIASKWYWFIDCKQVIK